MKQNKTLVLILGVLLAAAVVVGLIFGIKALTKANTDPAVPTGASDPAGTTNVPVTGENGETTESSQAPAELTPEMKAAKTKDAYTEADLKADDPRLDQVVAECAGSQLTNRQAQVYYVMQYYGFMNQFGGYASMFGLDDTKPLSEQPSMQEELSWEQLFLLGGMQEFQQWATLAAEAEKAGFQLSEAREQELQSFLDGLKEAGAAYGYESADAYLAASFGLNVRVEDYEAYMRTQQRGFYFVHDRWTDEDLRAYFDEHPEDFEGIDPELTNVNVRHILITPEAAEDATEEEAAAAREAAKAKAEGLLESFLKEPSEEAFAALATEYTQDPGSQASGGLYEGVYPGQMVEPFNDWCFDAARKIGDTGVVETEYGFHVMFFVGRTDQYYWKETAASALTQDAIAEIMENAPELTVRYEDVVLAPLPQPEEE